MSRRRLAVLRADASTSIGTGHLVRSLTLAARLADRGWEIALASGTLPPGLRDEVRARGFQLIEVPTPLVGSDEVEHVRDWLDGRSADLTVVDHYGLGRDWHLAARSWSRLIMVIDDLANSPADADLVLNQNLGESPDAYADLVPDGCRLLVGPEYALLRPEFARERASMRERRQVDRLLVFLGGSDEPDVTATAARAGVGLAGEIDVVVGAAYPHWAALRTWAEREPRVTLHRNVPGIARLMARADLSIGAPGSASWERCCLGLPSILITLADNQRRAAEALARAGAAVDLGWHDGVTVERLSGALAALARSPSRLASMSRSAAAVTDGRGTQRVEREIMRLSEGGPAGG